MPDLAVWLEASMVARALKAGPWVYPLANLAHLLGIALLFGAIAALDLRLLGVWPEAPLAALARVTVPVAGMGLALALLTGPALLTVRATEYVENPFLWVKLGAVAVGLANLAALHRSAAWRAVVDRIPKGKRSAVARTEQTKEHASAGPLERPGRPAIRSNREAQHHRRRLALAGGVSLAAWIAAVSAGRLIAYW